MQKDMRTIVEPALALVQVPLNQNQVNALASLIYNIGGGAFKDSTSAARFGGGGDVRR